MSYERARLWTLRVGVTFVQAAIGFALAVPTIECVSDLGYFPPVLVLVWGGWLIFAVFIMSIAWGEK
jgi:hypothetical protein